MGLGRRFGFLVCFGAILAYEGYALFVHEAGQTSHLPPARDLHLTREIDAGHPLSQTFVMHAEGFKGIELFPRRADQPPVGPVDVTISNDWEADGRWETMTRVTVDAASLDLTSSWVIPTPRIDLPAGILYRLEVALPQAPPGHGLRFEAGGPTYLQGAMEIGGQRQWDDLKFRTEAQRTTVFRNVQRLRLSLPPVLRSDLFWISMLLLINWAMGTVLYSLAFAPEPVSAPARQRTNGSAAVAADQARV